MASHLSIEERRAKVQSDSGAAPASLRIAVLTFVFTFAIAPGTARATPEDFRVLTDELSERGEIGAEFQVAAAKHRNSGFGSQPAKQQALAEFSYGLRDDLELAVQFPAARDGGSWRGIGVNIEVQYIAPHDPAGGLYWGGRAEIGRGRPAGEADMVSSLELRPIIGYRDGPWHAILNAGVKVQLTGTNRHTDREPSAKVTYRAFERTAVGVEYYVEAGTQTGHAPPAGQQHLAVLVMDTQIGNARLNLGVGRGLTARSAGTVAKLIASFEVK